MRAVLKCSVAVASVVFVVYGLLDLFEWYLGGKVGELYPLKERAVVEFDGNRSLFNKSIALKEKAAESDAFFILGSSELSSGGVKQNIKNLFPNNEYPKKPFCVGAGYTQNAWHAINLGSSANCYKGKDVVLVQSIQWFSDDYARYEGFLGNLSELQIMEFLKNPTIKEWNKLYLCSRIIEIENIKSSAIERFVNSKNVERLAQRRLSPFWADLLVLANKYGVLDYIKYITKRAYKYPEVDLYVEIYKADNILYKIAGVLMEPYYRFRYRFLKVKDCYDVYSYLRAIESKGNVVSKSINWDDVYAQAEVDGEGACTTNEFFINDEVYLSKIEPRLEELRNRYPDETLNNDEWEDYEFLLNVCKDLNIKPYVVIVPLNGWYYDYYGWKKNVRAQYYEHNREVVEKYGFEALTFPEKEYEKYCFRDMMHLGWKGWPYVSQNIIKHFKQ